MKVYLDCYPCLLKQAINAAQRAGCSEDQKFSIMNKVLNMLQDMEPGASPPEIARHVHGLVRKVSGSLDPYKEAKKQSTRAALALYPELKALIEKSDDRLGTALRLSIAGNIIDLGIEDEHEDLWHTVNRVLAQDYAIDNEQALRTALENADSLLYLGDNTGETVFDRLLIEELNLPITYAVRGMPILNDATMEDALEAGLDKVARLIDNGVDVPGTIMSLCSEEFVEAFQAAPLVIAKGQGNYETMSDTASPKVFFLLQVKCQVIARDMNTPQGSIVIQQGQA